MNMRKSPQKNWDCDKKGDNGRFFEWFNLLIVVCGL